jgi:hypothetical protein
MEIATLGQAALLIALASARNAVANGAEVETLNIGSAPRILGPLKGFAGQEETHVAPNGETIITGIG